MITAKVVAMHSPGRKGAFTSYVDKFLAFFDHLSLFVYIFHLIKVDIFDYLLTQLFL